MTRQLELPGKILQFLENNKEDLNERPHDQQKHFVHELFYALWAIYSIDPQDLPNSEIKGEKENSEINLPRLSTFPLIDASKSFGYRSTLMLKNTTAFGNLEKENDYINLIKEIRHSIFKIIEKKIETSKQKLLKEFMEMIYQNISERRLVPSLKEYLNVLKNVMTKFSQINKPFCSKIGKSVLINLLNTFKKQNYEVLMINTDDQKKEYEMQNFLFNILKCFQFMLKDYSENGIHKKVKKTSKNQNSSKEIIQSLNLFLPEKLNLENWETILEILDFYLDKNENHYNNDEILKILIKRLDKMPEEILDEIIIRFSKMPSILEKKLFWCLKRNYGFFKICLQKKFERNEVYIHLQTLFFKFMNHILLNDDSLMKILQFIIINDKKNIVLFLALIQGLLDKQRIEFTDKDQSKEYSKKLVVNLFFFLCLINNLTLEKERIIEIHDELITFLIIAIDFLHSIKLLYSTYPLINSHKTKQDLFQNLNHLITISQSEDDFKVIKNGGFLLLTLNILFNILSSLEEDNFKQRIEAKMRILNLISRIALLNFENLKEQDLTYTQRINNAIKESNMDFMKILSKVEKIEFMVDFDGNQNSKDIFSKSIYDYIFYKLMLAILNRVKYDEKLQKIQTTPVKIKKSVSCENNEGFMFNKNFSKTIHTTLQNDKFLREILLFFRELIEYAGSDCHKRVIKFGLNIDQITIPNWKNIDFFLKNFQTQSLNHGSKIKEAQTLLSKGEKTLVLIPLSKESSTNEILNDETRSLSQGPKNYKLGFFSNILEIISKKESADIECCLESILKEISENYDDIYNAIIPSIYLYLVRNYELVNSK